MSSSRDVLSGAGLTFVFGVLFPRTARRMRWPQRLGPRGLVVHVAAQTLVMVWLQRRLGPWAAELEQVKPGWEQRLREELGREPTRDERNEAYLDWSRTWRRERRPRATRRVVAGVVHVDIEVRVGGTAEAVRTHAGAPPPRRRWRHARTITAADPGVRIHDRLEYEPRLLPPALVARVVGCELERRHRALRRRFGAPEAAATPPPEPARPASPQPGG